MAERTSPYPTPDSRRLAHVMSEKKRRNMININFEELRQSVPGCNSSDSKAVILRKATEYINQLRSENEKLRHLQGAPSTDSKTESRFAASSDSSYVYGVPIGDSSS
ncbi:uncharacterized protein VTP21DRAFT_1599 [Calcarisporiella thermophila]|uniref:uncharacterized protein n=1 Tax=Calcarisporiella thermophila TaxID=911321 RepID=UPI003743F1B2